MLHFPIQVPRSSAWLLAALAYPSLAWAQVSPTVAPVQSVAGQVGAVTDLSSGDALATGSTVARTLADRAAEMLNVRDFGAKGDATYGSSWTGTDDSAAFAAAITQSNTLLAAGTLKCIYVPPGVYHIAATSLPAFTNGGCVIGAANWKSVIQVDPTYAGDVFSWTDAWGSGVTNPGNTGVAHPRQYGVRAEHLTVMGDQSATVQQNAFVLYDHIDFAHFSDLDVSSLHGRALYMGGTKNDTVAYVRESRFENIRAFNSGMTGVPVVEIATSCANTQTVCAAQDGTNEIRMRAIDIYGSRGPSFVIHNLNAYGGSTRDIRISQMRIEGTENNTYNVAADLMNIGDSSSPGKVAYISCTDCEFISPYTGYVALRLGAASSSVIPTGISLVNAMVNAGGGGGGGVSVDAGSALNFQFAGLGSLGTNVTIGASPMTAPRIFITGGGSEAYWTWNIDPTAVGYVQTSWNHFGLPTSGVNNGYMSAAPADGSSGFGNTRGQNSVDWQTARWGATQVASGWYSVVGGGQGNTANMEGGVIAGGYSNTAGYRAVIGGGSSNVAGYNYGTIPGGWGGNTLGNFGMMAYATGRFATAGDAEMVWSVLRAATSGTTATRLTADGTGTANSNNTLNPAANSAWSVDLDCIYRDTTSSAVASWYWKDILLVRGASASATTVSVPSVTTGATSGTPGASVPGIAADTTNGGLAVSFTAPNSDASHIVCRAKAVVVQ